MASTLQASLPVDTRHSRFARWRGLALQQVQLDEAGFWGARQRTNRAASLAHGARMLEEAGNLHNLRLAAGTAQGDYRGPVFMDSDVYKWLEAVAYASAGGLEADVRAAAETAIGLIEAAQAPDGYLDSYYQVVAPDRRWVELNTGHELYCAGHLLQAAIAWHRYAGDDRLLNVSLRQVEHILEVFGPGKRTGVPGHPEIELALVELYRLTGRPEHLELAQFFVDHRGYGLLGPNPRFGGSAYYQDRVPIREASEVEGHAVRALYLATGVADVYLETGEQALLEALLRQWSDFVGRKLYITGGAGSRHSGEAFGHPYELPTERAYCETCAAIASIMWNWRLLLATGQARFADLIERTLYNGFLSGVSLDGERFFYVNPLLSRGQPELVGRGIVQRAAWFFVACCPPNVMRLLASLDHYVASHDADGIQLHQYAPSTIRAELDAAGPVALHVATDYPWNGHIEIRVERSAEVPWSLWLRRPAWCAAPRLQLNGQRLEVVPNAQDYFEVHRAWQAGDRLLLELPTPGRLTEPHPRVEASRGCLAIERGPLVYCLEQADYPADTDVLDLAIDSSAPLGESWQPDLLGGIMALSGQGAALDLAGWGDSTFRPLRARVIEAAAATGSTPQQPSAVTGAAAASNESGPPSGPPLRTQLIEDVASASNAPAAAPPEASTAASGFGHSMPPRDAASSPPRPVASADRPVRLVAIPYFAWANRAPGAMRVWIPRASTAGP
jgi:DUF1680 family protein